MNKTLLSVFVILLAALPLRAQEKISVTSEAAEGKVFIYYELQGNPAEDYEISLLLRRTSQPTFSYSPEELEGDFNEGKFATGKRKITWKLTPEEKKMFFEGDDYYFEVLAKPSGGGTSWYYYLGAALVAGGAAAAIITWNQQGDGGGRTSDQTLPTPPGRP
ncbi:MAG: hypothetical protein HF314_16270 [Ignavibacteria bacterium]|jgi:hypothetical protein|nr:hypothetical protein [Ignavibacteria bacterium]MCU7504638.1 hypothetical protein [Ignavibacteria bacterium]MCU7517554.1 hypothetical protein [Ignavibacteria bacterium]